MNVGRGLNPNNPEEYVSGRGAGDRVGRLRVCKGCAFVRGQRWHRGKQFRSKSLWLGPFGKPYNTWLQTLPAAIWIAAGPRNLLKLLAVHAQVAHRHATVGSAVPACGSPHAAGETCQWRVCRQEHDHNEGDDLEEPLHRL